MIQQPSTRGETSNLVELNFLDEVSLGDGKKESTATTQQRL